MQLSILNLEFSFCFVWIQTRMLNQFKHISPISSYQTILNIHTIHQTIHISQSSHLAMCPAVCTVLRVHCTTWCIVQFKLVCRVQWFLLQYQCKFLISVEGISSPNYFHLSSHIPPFTQIKVPII